MNFKVLADNLYIDEDEYLALLGMFFDSGGADLKQCRAAIAAGDAGAAALAIHSFKGASGQLGLTKLHQGAIAAEKDIKNNQMAPGAEKTARLLEEMGALAALVRSSAATLSNG